MRAPLARLRVLAAAVMMAGVLVVTPVMSTSAAAYESAPDVPPDIDALIHAAADYRGASYWQMVTILRCESGHWNRAVIEGRKLGRDGEIGIAQILPKYGLGPLFESRGGDYSASDSIYFMAWALTHGLRYHWHC